MTFALILFGLRLLPAVASAWNMAKVQIGKAFVWTHHPVSEWVPVPSGFHQQVYLNPSPEGIETADRHAHATVFWSHWHESHVAPKIGQVASPRIPQMTDAFRAFSCIMELMSCRSILRVPLRGLHRREERDS